MIINFVSRCSRGFLPPPWQVSFVDFPFLWTGNAFSRFFNGSRPMEDYELLKALQSEILHEQSLKISQGCELGSLGDFVLKWDSMDSQDIVLQKKCKTGEEMAVSALLVPLTFPSSGMVLRDALAKVCISKPGLASFLQFDCRISFKNSMLSEFSICNACYLQSSSTVTPVLYKGPLFSTLDPRLQEGLKEYLLDKGIEDSLTTFILYHLHHKEQKQYLNWLRQVESTVSEEN